MFQAGFGFFQWITLFISGLGLSGVGAEIFVIPYILPNAEVELCIPEKQKKWLSMYNLQQSLFFNCKNK